MVTQTPTRALRTSQHGSALDLAILKTLIYADIFGFPMRDTEIQHFLIGYSATLHDVQTALKESSDLAVAVECQLPYFALRDRTFPINQRDSRDQASEQLLKVSRFYGTLLAHLPFVRMVALTGALAMRNAGSEADDIDFMLVTSEGRVWTARAAAILLVRLARLFKVKLCPNYVLAQSALYQNRQDLFIAHELAQMIPLSGLSVYEAMRAENAWALTLLPNAAHPLYTERDCSSRGIGRILQRVTEFLLSGPPGDVFERWEKNRKIRKFAADSRKAHSAAQIDGQQVKGHFNDYGYPTLERYAARLKSYDLEIEE